MVRNIIQKVLPDRFNFVKIFLQDVFDVPVCNPVSIVCPFTGSLQAIVPISLAKLQYAYARVIRLFNEEPGGQYSGNY